MNIPGGPEILFQHIGNLTSLVIGLVISPCDVLSLTTRTRPSSPGNISVIRPVTQVAGGVLASLTMTKSLTSRLGFAFSHLGRCCREVKYS